MYQFHYIYLTDKTELYFVTMHKYDWRGARDLAPGQPDSEQKIMYQVEVKTQEVMSQKQNWTHCTIRAKLYILTDERSKDNHICIVIAKN